MPDPRDPTPVKVVQRGAKYVIVDASGKKLADGDEYDDKAKAQADAATVNGSWKKAKADRKAKGAPAITEGLFNAVEHPRERGGEFRGVTLRDGKNGLSEVFHSDGHYLGSMRMRVHATGTEVDARDHEDKSLGVHPSMRAALRAIKSAHGLSESLIDRVQSILN